MRILAASAGTIVLVRDRRGSSNDPPPEAFPRSRRFLGIRGFLQCFKGLLRCLFVLWLLVQSVRAQGAVEEFGLVPYGASGWFSGLVVTVQESEGLSVAALLNGREGCDGSVLWEISKAFVLIGIWETGRWECVKHASVGNQVSRLPRLFCLKKNPRGFWCRSRVGDFLFIWLSGFLYSRSNP